MKIYSLKTLPILFILSLFAQEVAAMEQGLPPRHPDEGRGGKKRKHETHSESEELKATLQDTQERLADWDQKISQNNIAIADFLNTNRAKLSEALEAELQILSQFHELLDSKTAKDVRIANLQSNLTSKNKPEEVQSIIAKADTLIEKTKETFFASVHLEDCIKNVRDLLKIKGPELSNKINILFYVEVRASSPGVFDSEIESSIAAAQRRLESKGNSIHEQKQFLQNADYLLMLLELKEMQEKPLAQ